MGYLDQTFIAIADEAIRDFKQLVEMEISSKPWKSNFKNETETHGSRMGG